MPPALQASSLPAHCARGLAAVVLALLSAVAQPDGSPAPAFASSLTRPSTAEKGPGPDGFIQRWLVLEPIRSNSPLTDNAVGEAVKKEYFPDQLSVVPKDGDTVIVGGEGLAWHALDTTAYNFNLYHFARARGKPTSFVLFWAVTIVNCPEEVRDARLAIGSNAASVWWVNGQQVIGIYGDRQTVIDDGVSHRLNLRKGPNVVRCAVINGGGATDFCARFLDANDRPLQGFTVTLPSAGP